MKRPGYRPSPAMIQKAVAVLEKKAGRILSLEEGREACINLIEFVSILAEWKAKVEMAKQKNGSITA